MNNTVKSSVPAKTLLSKTTVTTLSVSLLILAVSVLGRSVSAMIYNQKLSICYSLYQIFGAGSIGIVNLATGILSAALLTFLAIGLLVAHTGAKADTPSFGGLAFLKMVLVAAIIYTSLGIVVCFGSVSVINYTDIEGYNGNINFTAAGLFWLTIVLGTAILCTEIAFIRLFNSLIRNMENGSLEKKGTMLIFAAGILGFIASIVNFCTKLYHLVTPPANYVQDTIDDKPVKQLTNAELLLNSFNVIIFAVLVVIFVCSIMLSGSYAMHTDTIRRTARMNAFNQGHTMINPEVLPDYTNEQNYNYHQSPNFVPYYNMNQRYQDIYKNIYTGEVPPIPEAPEMPFKPKTQYPAQNPAPVNASDSNGTTPTAQS